jgi:hypothetical protein
MQGGVPPPFTGKEVTLPCRGAEDVSGRVICSATLHSRGVDNVISLNGAILEFGIGLSLSYRRVSL